MAAALAGDLARLGYSVWWDFEILGGVNFRQEIHRELQAARAVVVLWTPASVQSRWVQEEADEAQHLNKIIPIRSADLDPRQVPLGFRSLQTLKNGDVEALQRALARHVEQKKQKSNKPKINFAEGVSRRTLSVDSSRVEHDAAHEFENRRQGEEVHLVLVDGRAFGANGYIVSSNATNGYFDGFRCGDNDHMMGWAHPKYLESIGFADSAIERVLQEHHPELRGKCCPILAAYIYESELYWASAGDVALLLYRDGVLTRLNADHSMGAYLDEMAARGEISTQEAVSAPNRQAQRSGLSGSGIPIVDQNDEAYILKEGDWLLLTTQGLFQAVSGGEIARCIGESRADGPEQLVQHLLREVRRKQRPQQDNVRIVAVHYGPPVEG